MPFLSKSSYTLLPSYTETISSQDANSNANSNNNISSKYDLCIGWLSYLSKWMCEWLAFGVYAFVVYKIHLARQLDNEKDVSPVSRQNTAPVLALRYHWCCCWWEKCLRVSVKDAM